MKILITGGKGMLGRTLNERLSSGHEIFIADLPEVDILKPSSLNEAFSTFKPDVVIHCAAMTKVDDCESNEELAFRLNGMGSANVAKACAACGARLIAISTDYVFSGDVREWQLCKDGVREDVDEGWHESDVTFPRTVYGKSKLAGERSILDVMPDAVILRIAWLYGKGGPSFVHTMAKLGAQEGAPLKVVNDQRGNPTSADVVADEIAFIIQHPQIKGIVHGTCEGVCSWYELTVELFKLLGLKREVVACTTEEFQRPAPRPENSALAKTVLKSFGYSSQRWQEALLKFIKSEFSNQ